jgi:hypothetical protein
MGQALEQEELAKLGQQGVLQEELQRMEARLEELQAGGD